MKIECELTDEEARLLYLVVWCAQCSGDTLLFSEMHKVPEIQLQADERAQCAHNLVKVIRKLGLFPNVMRDVGALLPLSGKSQLNLTSTKPFSEKETQD